MAVVQVNEQSLVRVIRNASEPRLYQAANEIQERLIDTIVSNASEAGSAALASRSVYQDDINVNWGGSGLIVHDAVDIKITYDQSRLSPPVGSDIDTWRHTSPTGDDPEDYRDLVDSGNAGPLFNHSPSWAGSAGYWSEAMAEIPTIVGSSLRHAGLIFGY